MKKKKDSVYFDNKQMVLFTHQINLGYKEVLQTVTKRMKENHICVDLFGLPTWFALLFSLLPNRPYNYVLHKRSEKMKKGGGVCGVGS